MRVDFILHKYPMLASAQTIDGVKLAAVQDVAAMKINAVTKRGAKKDFYDIAELLDHYSLADVLEFYSEKYANRDLSFVLRSLVYFDDADAEPDPLSPKLEWPHVKEIIVKAVTEYFN